MQSEVVFPIFLDIGLLFSEPRALRIISPKTGKDGYQVEEEAICEILNHPDVIDTPVIVISIAGAMREGKSFLLSLLIAYLESGMVNKEQHAALKPCR